MYDLNKSMFAKIYENENQYNQYKSVKQFMIYIKKKNILKIKLKKKQ